MRWARAAITHLEKRAGGGVQHNRGSDLEDHQPISQRSTNRRPDETA
jgi:hypothetical protein